MPKTRRVIQATLPPYRKDRQEWRRQVLKTVRIAAEEAGVEYSAEQQLDVEVLLYMKGAKRHAIHDVDNRLKDILDALQGRFRGPSGKKLRLIENDNKICRALIEKRATPKQYKNTRESPGGKITIRPYRKSR